MGLVTQSLYYFEARWSTSMEYLDVECIPLTCQNLYTLGGDNKVNVAIAEYKPPNVSLRSLFPTTDTIVES